MRPYKSIFRESNYLKESKIVSLFKKKLYSTSSGDYVVESKSKDEIFLRSVDNSQLVVKLDNFRMEDVQSSMGMLGKTSKSEVVSIEISNDGGNTFESYSDGISYMRLPNSLERILKY
jgi:hypothetical protein